MQFFGISFDALSKTSCSLNTLFNIGLEYLLIVSLDLKKLIANCAILDMMRQSVKEHANLLFNHQ